MLSLTHTCSGRRCVHSCRELTAPTSPKMYLLPYTICICRQVPVVQEACGCRKGSCPHKAVSSYVAFLCCISCGCSAAAGAVP